MFSSLFRRLVHLLVDSILVQRAVRLVMSVLPVPSIVLTHHTVTVRRLSTHLDGLRILHLSDLHLHPGSDLAWQLPELVARTPHDLLVYTGDFIDVDSDIPLVADLLQAMPQGVPTIAVLGNHDYIPYGRTINGAAIGANDVAALRRLLSEKGIDLLFNRSRRFYDGALVIAGVDDPSTGRDDINMTMDGLSDDAAVVLLAHSPDIALRLGGHRPDLILAGHTHGGQVRLPIIGPLLTLTSLPRHLAMGLSTYRGVPIFVSRGIGYSSLQIRIGTPAEATIITLRAPRHDAEEAAAQDRGEAEPAAPADT